jgi:arabinose-5-phosphate isomerase
MDFPQKARAVLDIELAALRRLRDRLREPVMRREFTRAVETIVACMNRRGKVVVVGVGKSGNIGHKIAATLTSTGTTSVVLNPVDALHGDLGVLGDNDVVLALSYSGESEEMLRVLPWIKRFAVRIISVTGNPKSTLARSSDVVLNVAVEKEACPFNLAPTASTTAMLVMGDMLAMVALEARGFRQQDYARLHPGGSIGRSLLLRIADIMRKGVRNATIRSGRTVKEALLAMTAAKSGSISVVDGRGKLVGIFTDGDFRRRMAADEQVWRRRIDAVMTRQPVVIRDDALAVEALKIFNEREIDDLIVVDGRHRPVGIVDSQDLPKFKIM